MSTEGKVPSQDIKVKFSNLLSNESMRTVHLLPCRVECDSVTEEGGEGCAPAKVATFFTPVIRGTNEKVQLSNSKSSDKELNSVHSATFRGRRLKGVKVNIPNGYTGCVLKESNPANGDQAREFEASGHFQDFNYWNLQTTPTTDDKLFEALTWSRLAQSFHRPLPVTETSSSTCMDT